jgi:hypothetical protein
MTNRITKSQVTSAGISLEDFPARVAAHSEVLKAWVRDMNFVVAEGQHPPRKPDPAEYPDPEKYSQAVARYEVELSKLTVPYLPPNVPYVVLWALNRDWLPDFEIVEDADVLPPPEGDL